MALTLDGTSGVVAPVGTVYNGIQSATAQASTSGTSINFTGIPSWVKRITVMYSGLSTNGSSGIQVQLGTSSGLKTSGYTGVAMYVGATNSCGGLSFTTGLPIANNASTDFLGGSLIITNITGNTWVCMGTNGHSNNNYGHLSGGDVTLSGVLTQLAINNTNGTDTFDAGSVNILYE
jgi:hypothetical protein